MVEGRCMKCRKQVEIQNDKVSKTKRGTFLHKGKCPICGTTTCSIRGE